MASSADGFSPTSFMRRTALSSDGMNGVPTRRLTRLGQPPRRGPVARPWATGRPVSGLRDQRLLEEAEASRLLEKMPGG
jgi:hypothetical protein